MSKRKKNDPNPADDDDDADDQYARNKSRQKEPQKVYDFHKKTTEVYPERLRELNRQFLASISSQVTAEPYSVLVGNCLDYVRQYFIYEDDLLKYSPWLAVRLKQSHADIVKCLQETIDVYEALARNDFDRIIDKTNTTVSSTIRPTNETSTTTTNKLDNTISPIIPTTSLNTPIVTAKTTATNVSTTTATSVSITPTPITTTASLSTFPILNTAKTVTTTSTNDATPAVGFSFKLPTSTSSKQTTNDSPFKFSMPTTGFGTSTFTSPTFSFGAADKSTTGSASSISFAPPSQISFAPPSSTTETQPTADDNDDEPNEPPEPEKVQHETDAKLTYKCRMAVFKGSTSVKRGSVQVVLKENNQKHQLIIRSDDTLGRLFLNILWTKLIKIEKKSVKDITFVCQLNPGMPEIKEGEFVTILFRFDSETDRNDAFEKLEAERK